jgi:O-antigen/teichoic acid export membrane protein
MTSGKNIFYNFINQLVSVLFPFFLIPLLSRTIGAEGLGIYSYTQAILQFFLVVGTFGLDIYGQRKIGAEKDDPIKRAEAFLEIFYLRLILSALVLILFLGCTFLFFKEYRLFFFISSVFILSSMLDLSWFYIGTNEYSLITTRTFVVKICSLAMVAIFVRGADSLPYYFIITACTNLFANTLLWLDLFKRRNIHFHRIALYRLLKIMPFSLSVLAFQIITIISGSITKLLIAKYVSIKDLGEYDTSMRLILVIVTLVCAIPGTFVAQIAYESSHKMEESLKNLMEKLISIIGLIAIPASGGLMVVSSLAAKVFLGNAFEHSGRILMLGAPIIYFNSLSYVVGSQYQIYSHKEKRFSSTLFISFVIGTLACILVIPRFGVIGAIVTAVLGEAMVLNIHIFRSLQEINFFKIILRCNWKPLVATGIMMLIVSLSERLLGGVSAIICLTIEVLIGAVVYEVSVLFLKDRTNLIAMLKIINKLFPQCVGRESCNSKKPNP